MWLFIIYDRYCIMYRRLWLLWDVLLPLTHVCEHALSRVCFCSGARMLPEWAINLGCGLHLVLHRPGQSQMLKKNHKYEQRRSTVHLSAAGILGLTDSFTQMVRTKPTFRGQEVQSSYVIKKKTKNYWFSIKDTFWFFSMFCPWCENNVPLCCIVVVLVPSPDYSSPDMMLTCVSQRPAATTWNRSAKVFSTHAPRH